MFEINGEWRCFDYSIRDYTNIKKCGVPYICMFGINDDVFYFRDLMFFGDVLEYISDSNVKKFLFIHNLSYEFQFLLNIIESKKWTIEKMCSRDIRKPISFYIPEINIEFRCTYMLTNMSLDMASKIYTNVNKKTGQLDYNVSRGTSTPLSPEEIEYCEYDIKCLYRIVKYYRDDKYKGMLYNIPLTSTGEVRKEIKNVIDYWYIKKMQSLVPSRKMYMIYMMCFSGGYTHSNILRTGWTQHNVSSYDIASSYPSVFFNEFPSEEFRYCPVNEYDTNDRYYYIVHVEFKNVKCKYYNTFIQKSKIVNEKMNKSTYDNGRLMSCDGTFEMFLCDIDFKLICDMYTGEFSILECWKSKKGFLDKRILKFVLQMYSDKTTLKGKENDTPENLVRYRKAKSNVNSLYGCCVSNVLKQSSDFKNGQWQRFTFTDEFIDSKIDEAKKSYSTLFQYTTGLYVTSMARENLIRGAVLPIDKDVIYCDTDSCKFVGKHDDVFNRFNESVIERYQKVIERYPDDFTIDDFSPIDSKGVKHTIGFFECENDGDILEFVTRGAKKYCYRLNDGLHLTLSGVNKSGVVALKDDINNFKNDFTFNYNESGKLIHYYDDEQPMVDFIDCNGVKQHSEYKHGIILQPTTYTIGTTIEYMLLLQEYEIYESEIEYGQ